MFMHKRSIGFRVAGKALGNQLGFVIGPSHVRHFNESDERGQQFL
jgi:hypothetical protein